MYYYSVDLWFGGNVPSNIRSEFFDVYKLSVWLAYVEGKTNLVFSRAPGAPI